MLMTFLKYSTKTSRTSLKKSIHSVHFQIKNELEINKYLLFLNLLITRN